MEPKKRINDFYQQSGKLHLHADYVPKKLKLNNALEWSFYIILFSA